MADFRLSGGVTVDARDAVQQLDRLEQEVAQANVAMREQASAAAAAGRALDKLKADTLANADAVAIARQELVEAERAQLKMAAAAKAAQQALREHQVATGQVAQSSGAARAAMTNLGQQIGDITMGLSMGVAPATIFAQQAGQVAFAVQGMGGAMAGVGRFLGGPWGIALTTALVALSPFVAKLFDGEKAARVAADGTMSFAKEAAVALGGISDLAGKVFNPLVTGFEAAIQGVRRRLPTFEDVVTKAFANLDRLNGFGANVFGTARTDWAGDYQRRRTAAVASNRKEDDLDGLMAFIDEVNAGQSTREFLQRNLDQQARQAEAAAKAAAAEYTRLAEAFNPLLAAQLKYKQNLDDIARAEARGVISAQAAIALRREATPLILQPSVRRAASPLRISDGGLATSGVSETDLKGLGAAVGAGLQETAAGIGLQLASDFATSVIAAGQVIGGAIGQGMSRTLQRASGIAGLLDVAQPGQGDAFFKAFTEVGRQTFRPLVKSLDSIFGGENGTFAKSLGTILGGAGVGGGVADIASTLGIGLSRQGSEIGGAIGSAVGGLKGVTQALGQTLSSALPLIGGVLGGVVGKLLAPRNPFADVALTTTAAGVSGSVFNSRGQGSGARGNTLASAVQDQLSRLASALGADIRPGQSLGTIGFSGDQFFFNRTGGDFKAPGNERFGSAEEAVAAAVASALSSNVVMATPRVQAALQRYAGNVNQAVAEALKVRDLEQLLESRDNPFMAAFRDFERQARARVDVARDYGFDLLAIERLNAEERKKLIERTLEQSIGSARALLDELQFGSRATGSFAERRAALLSERDRLIPLANAGDDDASQKLTQVLQQLLDVSSEGFGATGLFAADRAGTVSVLQQLIAQREAQIEAASTAAKTPDPQLTEANASLDDLVRQSQEQTRLLQQLVGVPAGPAGGGGGLAAQFARFVP